MLNGQSTYVALGPGGAAETIPVQADFWRNLMAGKFPVLEDGRLVAMFQVGLSWSGWEMHPAGAELVCLLSGKIELVLEEPDAEHALTLRHAGDFVLIPRGVWHRFRGTEPSSALFITPGKGTQHR